MPLSVHDVANYFLSLANPEVGDAITHLKLQKLCYYAQGFSLALNDKPLFDDRIEAWQHGPVAPALYAVYRNHGAASLLPPANLDLGKFSDIEKELLDEVYNVYGQFSAWKLRNMTHDEPPWKEAYNAVDETIAHSAMQEYFKTLVNE